MRGEEGHDNQRQVAEVRDRGTEHPLLRVTAAVSVDVRDSSDGPGPEQSSGSDGVHQTVGEGENLTHAEPLQGVLMGTLHAVELLAVRVALLSVHLGVFDVVFLNVRVRAQVSQVRSGESRTDRRGHD